LGSIVKFIAAALVPGILFGLYAAWSAYISGWLYDVWLLGFAIQGSLGAAYGLVVYSLGMFAVNHLRSPRAVAFLGSGITTVFAAMFTVGALSSRQSIGFGDIAGLLSVGALLGSIAYLVHVLLPNYAFKRTAGTLHRVS
jgi:hypothetical protein